MRASNGFTEPLIASSDKAPATSAAANTFSDSNNPRNASAVETCVPFSNASPSLGSSTSGATPAWASAACAERNSPLTRACPSPSSSNARCASGARSPLAPTEPFSGIQGMTPALNSASSVSTTSRRTPEWPRARLIILVAMTRRTTSSASSAPIPAQCDNTRLRCNSANRSGAMRVWASLPKPVLMP